MNLHIAERILSLVNNAQAHAQQSGRHFDLHDIYVKVLVRCGLCKDEARQLVQGGQDPVQHILHYAGDSHNYALLAVEEALAEAC